jgi:hypothetical protein
MKRILQFALLGLVALGATGMMTSCGEKTKSYTVTVTSDGNGEAGADPARAEAGEVVTLTATANEGYAFVRWVVESGGATLADATSAETTFTMPAGNVVVRAEFSAVDYTIATSVSPIGYGTASANPTTATVGTPITLTATPNAGYAFVRWVVENGDIELASATSAETTFTMPAGNVVVRAEFGVASYTVEVWCSPYGYGTGTANPTSATAGTTITLTATPNAGYAFSKWIRLDNGVTFTLDNTTTAETTFTMPAGNVIVMAEFHILPVGADPAYYGVWRAEDYSNQVTISENQLKFESTAGYCYIIDNLTWIPTIYNDANYPTGYKFVGTLTVVDNSPNWPLPYKEGTYDSGETGDIVADSWWIHTDGNSIAWGFWNLPDYRPRTDAIYHKQP